mgnify:CR=1 FL=1
MTYDELVKQLTADLQEAGQKNISPPSGVSDAEARDWSMANVAGAIAKAIRDGLVFDIKGSATVAELNAMPLDQRTDGDIWAVKDSGLLVNPDGEPLAVTAGDLVMWAGDAWSRIFHLDLTGYATVEQLNAAIAALTAAINDAVATEKAQREAADATEKAQRESADAALQNAINTHVGRTDNPHNVTAGQVGAYTKQETEDRISDAISGEVGGWLGNLTVAEVNALTTHKKGDSATLLDAGTVMPCNVTVDVGDDIMWVDSLGVWQPKITDHLHHDETLVGTGSANDPLGVNPETIEDNILRMRYRGGGRLKFWRTNPLPTT